MKKSTVFSGFFFSSAFPFSVKNVQLVGQNKIDEKRNVKQPPELLFIQETLLQCIPALPKLSIRANLYRLYSRDNPLELYFSI